MQRVQYFTLLFTFIKLYFKVFYLQFRVMQCSLQCAYRKKMLNEIKKRKRHGDTFWQSWKR